MPMVLHCGAKEISYDELRAVPVPEPTDTHISVAHHEIVELVRYTLGYHQHSVVQERHAVTPDGMCYFGIMALQSPYDEYCDTLALRDSNNRKFPISLAVGAVVLVCDNLSLVGEHVVSRGKVAERPDLTKRLHEVLDTVCQ